MSKANAELPTGWQDIFGIETPCDHMTHGLGPLPYLVSNGEISDEKRHLDMHWVRRVAPMAALPVLLGLFAVTTVDRVNPIYRQARVGYLGEPIRITKIRTMPNETANVSSEGHYDERRSRVGRALSKLRIDEAPQLVNICRGEMSVIGPRALVPADYADAVHILGPKKAKEWLDARTLVFPGAFDEFAVRTYGHQIEGDDEELLLQRLEMDFTYIFESASPEEDRRIFDTGKSVARGFVSAKLHRDA